jgi:transposase
MPWKQTRTVDQRLQFLSSHQKEEMSVTDLCHQYGISRPTAYKWIKRYDEVGPEGRLDLTRTPHSSPHATSAEIENEILALRKRFPPWGARKLKARLERMNPKVSWPAASTVGQILSRAGLTNPKRKERRASVMFSTMNVRMRRSPTRRQGASTCRARAYFPAEQRASCIPGHSRRGE